MTPVELAVDTYIAAARERRSEERVALLDQCWAENGRFITRSGEIRGRVEMNAMIGRFHADPNNVAIRINAIDARARSFRFSVTTDRKDGSTLEVFDAGMIDDAGQITLILTFAGPLVAVAAL
jgi:hypothetical protein